MTPNGFALTYTRAGDPQPHWLTKRYVGHVLDVMVICRTRAEANERRRELLATPGITDAHVWTLEETREQVEAAVERLPGHMYGVAAEMAAAS